MRTFTDLNGGAIQNLLGLWEERIKNAKVIPVTRLFEVEPVWSLLDERKCPVCGNKLRMTRNGLIAFCAGKKHGDRQKFVIRRSVLEGDLKIQK